MLRLSGKRIGKIARATLQTRFTSAVDSRDFVFTIFSGNNFHKLSERWLM